MSTRTLQHEPAHRPTPLALTMGDPAGIGPDITAAIWADRERLAPPPFVLFGCPETVQARATALGLTVRCRQVASPAEAVATFATALPVIPVSLGAPCRAGVADAANGAAVVTSITEATAAVQAGTAAALVTNPISKTVLYRAGFRYPGHTEFLAALAEAAEPGRRVMPVMLLASEALKVVPLTIHVPVSQVPGLITADLIVDTVAILHAALMREFAITRPRIVVAGLNPHAGEDGTMGREDVEIIAPAVARLAARGWDVVGPLSADTLFHAAARATYDAAVCMYHDQALIPIKTLSFETGVNVTLGLPFVRTSPDHGTAFALAGRGTASAASLLEALRLAERMVAARAVADTASTLGPSGGTK